jgi:hypothetical protein
MVSASLARAGDNAAVMRTTRENVARLRIPEFLSAAGLGAAIMPQFDVQFTPTHNEWR